VALDGYNLNERPLKVSYGTTKYCSSFIKGYECRNPECFYLHKFEGKKEVQNGDFKKEQNDEAFDIVCDNIEYVVEQMMMESGEE